MRELLTKYILAMNTHISDTLSKGWDKKNSIDWTNY